MQMNAPICLKYALQIHGILNGLFVQFRAIGYGSSTLLSNYYLSGQLQACATSCPSSSFSYTWTSASFSASGVNLSSNAIDLLDEFYNSYSIVTANGTFTGATCNSAATKIWQSAMPSAVLALLAMAFKFMGLGM